MTGILRIASAISSAVMVVTILLGGSVYAAPLKYQIDLTAGSVVGVNHPLEGGTLQLNITWDAAELPPNSSNDAVTWWPWGKTSGSLTVAGSASSDGIYDAAFLANAPAWALTDRTSSIGDSLEFPRMRFMVNGHTVRVSELRAFFDSSFINGVAPQFPKPFTTSEATWLPPPQFQADGIGTLVATVVSGSATAVPEPSTLALGSFSLLSLAALRRCK